MDSAYDSKTDKTLLQYENSSGILQGFAIQLAGNPFDLKPDKHVKVDIGGSSKLFDSDDLLRGFVVGEVVGNKFVGHFSATHMTPFTAGDFASILTTLPVDEAYHRFVGLLDDNTDVTGTKFTDRIEVGAGNDTVNALGGDDFVNKWDSGNLNYKGGTGFDTLDFSAADGAYFPYPKTQTLVLDLKTGEGLNPYGGKLKVDSIEKVIGTDEADRIYGSDGADWIETQDYGADLVKARGGNDTVVLWPFANGARLDGGAGKDTLTTAFEFDQNTLDLTDPSKNTGKFENGVIKNFEVFNFSSTSFDSLTLLTFKGTAKSETVTMSGSRTVILDLGNGDNRAQGGGGDDTITAGSGKDRLNGGAGDDFLTGGGASDLFVFSLGFGHDVIRDFDTSGKDHDRIDLSAIADIKNWTDLKAHHLTSIDGNATIETPDDDTIVLTSVKVKNLDENDFVFG
jgi:Ca2+-binding RTX toxin-like protein